MPKARNRRKADPTIVWCLIGLGNPGVRYQSTRHNVGFDLIDRLSRQWKIPVDQAGSGFLFGSGDYRDIPVLLAKPMTLMNRSGDTYRRLLREPEIRCEESLIALDDFSLPLGKLRIRLKGSDGGHNGLRSILDAAGTQDVPRLRIGIGEAGADWVDYVLEPFSTKEREIIEESLDRAAQAVETILTAGLENAMNRWNR